MTASEKWLLTFGSIFISIASTNSSITQPTPKRRSIASTRSLNLNPTKLSMITDSSEGPKRFRSKSSQMSPTAKETLLELTPNLTQSRRTPSRIFSRKNMRTSTNRNSFSI
jgi:hypothetical protein